MKPLIKNSEQQDRLLSAIKSGKNLILTADTGAGKSVTTTALLSKIGLKACIAQPRISNVKSVYDVTKKVFGSSIQWATAEEKGGDKNSNVTVMTDGLAVAMYDYLRGVDVVVIDEIHEFSNNQVSLLYLAKKLDKQIILLSATIDSKIELLLSYSNAQHLNFAGVRSYPVKTMFEKNLNDVVAANHNVVLYFGSGKKELSNVKAELLYLGIPESQIAILTAETQSEYLSQLLGTTPSQIKYWLATNVAQAGITPANCDAVVISGEKKEMHSLRFTDNLREVAISKEDFVQQAGRTGRTCEGTVYAMMSEEQYGELLDSAVPEIQRTRVSDLYLSFLDKGIKLENINDKLLFQVNDEKLTDAIAELKNFGCINDQGITEKGRLAAALPLEIGLGLGLAYAHKLGVAKEYILYTAGKSADNKYTITDSIHNVIPKRKGLYYRMKSMILKSYKANLRLISKLVNKLQVPVVDGDISKKIEAALILAAPLHLITCESYQLDDGEYNYDTYQGLCLVDKFAYRGRVFTNVIAQVAAGSPLYNIVAKPQIEEVTQYYSSYYYTAEKLIVKAANGKLVSEKTINRIEHQYDATNPIHFAQIIEQNKYSLTETISKLGFGFDINYNKAVHPSKIAESFDSAKWLKKFNSCKDILEAAEVFQELNECLIQRDNIASFEDFVEQFEKVGYNLEDYSKSQTSWKFYFSLCDKVCPPSFTYNNIDIECFFREELDNKMVCVKSFEEFNAKKNSIELSKHMDNVDNEIKKFKRDILKTQYVSLYNDNTDVITINDFLTNYMSPQHQEFGDERYSMVVAYRYCFKYITNNRDVVLNVSFDMDDVQNYELDIQKAVGECVPTRQCKSYTEHEIAELQEDFKKSSTENSVVIDGIRFESIKAFAYVDLDREVYYLSTYKVEDTIQLISDDFIKEVNDLYEKFNSNYDLVDTAKELIDEIYDNNLPYRELQSRIDKARNIMNTELITAEKELNAVISQARAELNKLRPDNSIGNMIDLSSLNNLFK